MNKRQTRRKAITLIEIIVVMVLIGVIGGIVAYNVAGSLDKGRIFKTEQGIQKIEQAIEIYLMTHPEAYDSVPQIWEKIVEQSSLVRDPDTLKRDGWGRPYRIQRKSTGYEVRSDSPAYEQYLQGKKQGP